MLGIGRWLQEAPDCSRRQVNDSHVQPRVSLMQRVKAVTAIMAIMLYNTSRNICIAIFYMYQHPGWPLVKAQKARILQGGMRSSFRKHFILSPTSMWITHKTLLFCSVLTCSLTKSCMYPGVQYCDYSWRQSLVYQTWYNVPLGSNLMFVCSQVLRH